MLAVLAFAWLLAAGQFSAKGVWDGDLLLISAIIVYAVTLGRAVLRGMGQRGVRTRNASSTVQGLRELELGLLLLTGAYLLIVCTGGVTSFLYPLVYALVSFLLIVHRRRWVVAAWLVAASILEILVARATGPAGTAGIMVAAYHITFILFFAAGNVLILAGLGRRLRHHHGKVVSAELERIRQEAADFRLIASQLPLASREARSREEEELRMAHGAVHGVHEQLFFTIDLLCSSLNLNTAALLWVEADEGEGRAPGRATPTLVIKEMATQSELVREDPRIDSPGILAAVVRDPKALRLKALKGRRIPPYYSGPEPVTDLCVLPLRDGATVRGYLCADRIDDRPFTDEEQDVLDKAGQQILRIIAQERSFAAVERGKYEQEQFYRASELLNQALTVDEVHAKTFAAIGAMAHYDLAVVTRFDDHAREHQVLAVHLSDRAREDKSWAGVAQLLHKSTFPDGASLVCSAVKNRHHMPATGDFKDSSTEVFDAKIKLDKARSLLVLPLVRGDQVLGTIVLASAKPSAYRTDTREMLRVMSHQIGVSLQNARMYHSMEERATTDGLTGLTNHRCFQERLEQLHDLCERTGQKYSLILTDIDHFKSVNDTYGHPVGDAVLKRVAAVFAGRTRKVDIVARYGGEEFVLVLPDTDSAGAALFANRLREEIMAQQMTSENGSFNVTLSLGVAEFPGDGRDRQELIEKADQALYYCKEHGRNRVTRVADMA
jgi:diguanylate cyclase (GGDEF)-like protein